MRYKFQRTTNPMFAKLREIFVQQYIGAMLIALLVWQSGVELITRIARIVYWYLNARRSVLAPSHYGFPWENLVFSVISIALYLMTAYLLARWLYRRDAPARQEHPESASEQL
jgi:hypothetical protein